MTNHEKHKQLWDDLRKKPIVHITFGGVGYDRLAEKSDHPGWKENGGEWEDDGYYCFACAEANAIDYDNPCPHCPIEWIPGQPGGCCGKESPYTKWEVAATPEKRSRWAEVIRDLPWKAESPESVSAIMDEVRDIGKRLSDFGIAMGRSPWDKTAGAHDDYEKPSEDMQETYKAEKDRTNVNQFSSISIAVIMSPILPRSASIQFSNHP